MYLAEPLVELKYIQIITQPCMGFANKMAPGVFEDILRAEHQSKTFHHVRFSTFDRELKPLKLACLAGFEKL